MAGSDLTAQRLREMLEFNPETGTLHWKRRPLHHFVSASSHKAWNTRHAGNVAGGSLDAKGRLRVNIMGTPHLAHRIAWAIYYGEFVSLIDHRNMIASDNRIANLRSCTNAENLRNRGSNKNNKSGYKGVDSHSDGRWRASITMNRRLIHLGLFDLAEDAHKAYCAAADRLHGEFANHG